MSEISDFVMPVLRSIESQLGSIGRDMAEIRRVLVDHDRKLDAFATHLDHFIRIRSRNRFDIVELRDRVRAVEDDLKSREPRH